MTQLPWIVNLALTANTHQAACNFHLATQGIYLFTQGLLLGERRITILRELSQLRLELGNGGYSLLVLLLHHIHVDLPAVLLRPGQLGNIRMRLLQFLL